MGTKSVVFPVTLVLLICLSFHQILGQNSRQKFHFLQPDSVFNKSRFNAVAIGGGGATALSLVALNEAWYKDHPRSSFHFHNDAPDWLQMDKYGHVFSAYYFGHLGIKTLRWAGVSENKAIWYGGTYGLAYQTAIEIFDGFSSEWGFSIGDMLANITGTALLISQEKAWGEQRIAVKFSAHLTSYAAYRPNLLGSTLPERILKDYNGQTYWLSFNVASLAGRKNARFDWLNIALGVSANGMIGSVENPAFDEMGNPYPEFKRYRQYFLSLDVDLQKIKTNSGFLKTLFTMAGAIKIPFSALEYNSTHGLVFHPLYF